MMVRRLFQCLALAAGAAIGSDAMAAYSVALQTANDCRHDGSVVVNLVVTGTDGPSIAAGGQFFLSYDAGLSVSSIVAGPAVMGVSLTFDNVGHTANVAVGAPFANPSAVFAVGQTLATITFSAPGNYCHQTGLVGFRVNNPATTLTDAGGNPLPVGTSALGSITLNDTTAPVITCPGDVTVAWSAGKDPWATGVATAIDTCDPSPVITYTDNRAGLTDCNGIGGRGTILRTWKATDHCANFSTCVQTITVTDTTPPVQTGCPADIHQNSDAGSCSAVVTYSCPTAYDQQHFQGFENPAYQAGNASITSPPSGGYSTDWSRYNSLGFDRVASGTDGVPSKTGAAHARITSTSIPPPPDDFTGAFSRLGGYSTTFANGFIASQDVYINLADPAVLASTYGWDLSTAANGTNGAHRRDFIFHTAGSPGVVLVGADNNSNFMRRNDLATINHYSITSTGWYTFEWNFRNNAGVLAVDMNLRDSTGTLLWTEVRSDPSDLIPSIVGGNRYMWFTFIAADTLHIDNTSLIRPLAVACNPPSGSTFPSGTTPVTASSVDACGNTTSCAFNVVVNPSNSLLATVEEAGLTGASTRCVTFDLWHGCSPDATVSGNVAFNSVNSVDFESYAPGNLPGATTPTDMRTPGGPNWWLPSNCATSGQVAAGVGRSGSNGLVVGNNANGNDGVIDNLKTPRLPFVAGETASPVNAASSVFRSSYWFRTASATPQDGFAFKSESYGPDRTTFFGAWYQTAFGDTNLNCGAYSIEQISGGVFDFVFHPIASNLSWGAWYRLECDVTFVNGANNDRVDYRLYDSSNLPVGSALGLRDWEEGARQFGYNGGQIFGIDAVQFQARGAYVLPTNVPHDVAYVDDITYQALPAILLDVPCATPAYTSITATDTKHTLRRTSAGPANFGLSGTNYYADFTSASGKALEQGNDNNDAYVDILDFGIFIGRYSLNLGANSPCGYTNAYGNFHPDFSGNGIVSTEDFTFIQSAFLHFRDLDPCGAPFADGGPVSDISVDDLVARGMREAAMADFNLDGRLNAADIAYIAQHGLPRCAADFNDDQLTDVSDIFSFLTAWFAGHPKADINGNLQTDVQDIFSFLNVWFQGC